ncbi:hypothetical protein KBA63_05520 [Candidatus Woesebacteria bacterium]|nr:hypothetical protein [Candidatus Woesebacteria bacterium]MBP9687627.1 hypothetical protein [Candidatus Woesebacteria bacterium]
MWKFPDLFVVCAAILGVTYYNLYSEKLRTLFGNRVDTLLPLLLVFWIGFRFVALAHKTRQLEKDVKIASIARVAAAHNAFVIMNETKGVHAQSIVSPLDPLAVLGTDAYRMKLMFTSGKRVSVLLKDNRFYTIDLTPFRIESGYLVRFRAIEWRMRPREVDEYYGIDETAGLEIIIEP